jgi:hypothetical protein
LVTIFVNHVPSNALEQLTTKNFGFSDAAEAFVLISGVSAALAYGPKFLAGAGLAATPTEIVPVGRSLYSSAAEELCVRVSVPQEIGNEYQEASTDLRLTFLAEQDPTDPHR